MRGFIGTLLAICDVLATALMVMMTAGLIKQIIEAHTDCDKNDKENEEDKDNGVY